MVVPILHDYVKNAYAASAQIKWLSPLATAVEHLLWNGGKKKQKGGCGCGCVCVCVCVKNENLEKKKHITADTREIYFDTFTKISRYDAMLKRLKVKSSSDHVGNPVRGLICERYEFWRGKRKWNEEEEKRECQSIVRNCFFFFLWNEWKTFSDRNSTNTSG